MNDYSLKRIYQLLLKAYGPQGWWPVTPPKKIGPVYSGGPRSDLQRFEVMVGAILTQNTSWNNVEKALANLQQAKMLSPAKISSVRSDVLAKKIKPSGYFNQKARKLKFLTKFIQQYSWRQLRDMDGSCLRELLLKIWGIGPETADSILLYALNKPFFVIDTYTKRIFARLGVFKPGGSYLELQDMFQRELFLDTQLYQEYHALIVKHGKEVCKKTPLCSQCILRKNCQQL